MVQDLKQLNLGASQGVAVREFPLKRGEAERFRAFSYAELTQRDKANLDIFWLKNDSLEDSANLPAPEILAKEISENLESALEQFSAIYQYLADSSRR